MNQTVLVTNCCPIEIISPKLLCAHTAWSFLSPVFGVTLVIRVGFCVWHVVGIVFMWVQNVSAPTHLQRSE